MLLTSSTTNTFCSYAGIDTHVQEEFEDTKGVIGIRKSKDRQQNGQKKKDKRTKHTHQIKDRVTRTPLKTGVNSGAPER